MIDFLAIIIGFFLIALILFIIFVGIKIFHSLFTVGKLRDNDNEETYRQLVEDSKENSEGDGLVLFDDPLFPEEPAEDC